MKRGMFILGVMLSVNTWCMAQFNKEDLSAEKEEYINEKAGFTVEEAASFWTLHDEMQTKQKELRRENRQKMKAAKKTGIDALTDEELTTLMNGRLEMEQKILDLRTEYHQKFIDLLGIRKTAKYYEAEMAWKKELIKKIKEKRGEKEGKATPEEDGEESDD